MTVVFRGIDWVGDMEFASVAEYEASLCWRLVRSVWRSRNSDASCFICGARCQLDLHHLSYDCLGFDEHYRVLDELVPLCVWHHHEVEKRIAAGVPRATAHLSYLRRCRRLRPIGHYIHTGGDE